MDDGSDIRPPYVYLGTQAILFGRELAWVASFILDTITLSCTCTCFPFFCFVFSLFLCLLSSVPALATADRQGCQGMPFK